ncbi:MAG: hypothetical protein ACFFG0_29870, partial [Candidatus Thorarchaeota archaeon]
NKDMYSLYRKVYLLKEKEIEKNIERCAKGKLNNIFNDTKIQNRCARVGQLKMFFKNISYFKKYQEILIKKWLEQSKHFFEEQSNIDLHIQMISTIRGAKEVFDGSYKEYKHKDELWIWIPEKDTAKIHLKKFLINFLKFLKSKDPNFEIEVKGNKTKILEDIFSEITNVEIKKIKQKKTSIAIIKYKAGSINSRKSMISPYLPKLMN